MLHWQGFVGDLRQQVGDDIQTHPLFILGAGYDTMFYSYTSFLAKNLDLSQLQGYDLWMAQYYPVPFCPYNFQIWQYDYQARVDGIDAPVDMNLLFTDYEPNWWSV